MIITLVKENHKISKYKEIEMGKMWHLKTTTVTILARICSRKGQIKKLTRYLVVPGYMK